MSEEAAAATRRSRRGRSGGSGNGDANEEAAAAFEQLRDVGALRHLIGRYDLLCVGASFALCILLLVKFFGFDKSPRCNDDLCEFQMTITLFSLAYTTIYALVLICGHLIVNRIALFSSSERAPLALISAGIGFAIVGVVAAIAVIYSVARFGQRWTRAGFYCFVLMLQPVFTLLAVLMKRTDKRTANYPRPQLPPTTTIVNVDDTTIAGGGGGRAASEVPSSADTLSPRLSAALIRQWSSRLAEVEMQENMDDVRRAVREVQQHMSSLIRY